jgi:hypothetical protein
MWEGVLEAIDITATSGGSMQSVAQVHAVPGRGLEGDRYFSEPGATPKDNKIVIIPINQMYTGAIHDPDTAIFGPGIHPEPR